MNDKKAKKIALIENLLPPYRISLFNQINADPNINLEVLLCSWKEKDRTWNVEEEEIQFIHHTFRGWNSLLRFSPSRSDYYHIHFNISLIFRLISTGYDAVIFSGYASLTHQVAIWITKIKKVPAILWYRSHDSSTALFRRIFSPYIDAIIKNSDALLVPGEKSLQHLVNRGADRQRIFRVGNTIDNDSFNQSLLAYGEVGKKEIRKQLGLADQKIILYVGRLVDVKGLFGLLDSFKIIENEIPGVLLLVVGDGYLRSDLENYCQEMSINSVKFEGFVQPSDLGKYYFSADVLTLPSHYETWGLVLNEAMIFGLPVVTTTGVGAAGEIVVDQITGFIVPPDDSIALAEALERILSDASLARQLGDSARALIAEQTPERSARGFIEAIRFAMKEDTRAD